MTAPPSCSSDSKPANAHIKALTDKYEPKRTDEFAAPPHVK
jgi:hypothetical protein